MKTKAKKFLAALLAAVMVMSLMPVLSIPAAAEAGSSSLTVFADASSFGDNAPFSGFNADIFTESEFIMPASELADMKGGTIKTMTFYAASSFVNHSLGNLTFEVYMAEVDYAAFSEQVFVSCDSMTKVVNGMVYSTDSNAAMTVTLDTPFEYQGGNLLICFHETVSGSFKTIRWQASEQTATTVLYRYSFNWGEPYELGEKYLPKTTFTYDPAPEPTVDFSLTVFDGMLDEDDYVPIYGTWANCYTAGQFVMPASALTDMKGGTIKAMTFYSTLSYANISWGDAKFEVYMAEVENNTLSKFVSFDSMTNVKNAASLFTDADAAMTVTLDTPFEYKGGNLLIGFRQTATGKWDTVSWMGEEQGGNTTVRRYNSFTADDIGEGTAGNFLPKTTFTYNLPTGVYINGKNPDTETAAVNGSPVKLTASVVLPGVTDTSVRWDAPPGAGYAAYSDEACTQVISFDRWTTFDNTIWVKFTAPGTYEFEAASNVDLYQYATCTVTAEAAAATHTHSWTYTSLDNSITAACSAEDCPYHSGLTVTVTAPESGDYTGKLFAATLDTSALPETLPDGLATPTLKYTTNGGKEIPAIEPGTYAAVLEWGGKSAADQFEIYAKTMTASAEKVEQTYDGNAYGISVSVTGPETYTVKYGTTEGTYNLDACPTKSEVGDGPLTVFYKITADHYSPVTGSATVTINPKLATVTAKDQTIKSDESIQTGPDYVTLKGELDGHTVAAVTLTDKDSALIPFAAVIYDADGKNVTANYDINYVNGVLTILGDIGHSAADVEKEYDGNAYGITVSVTGPETYTVKYGTKEGTYNLDKSPTISNVGDSPLTVYYLIYADGYSPAAGSAKVTITKKPVTITAKDQTIMSGEHFRIGFDYLTIEDVLEGHTLDAFGLSTEGTAIIPFAAVIVDAEGNDVTGNYDITYENGVLTILGDISYTAENVEKEYDGSAYGIAVNVTGPETYTVKYGTAEGTYDLDVSPAISDVADSPLTVYYQVTADGYSPAVGSATVTINPKPVTVTAKGQTLKENESIRTGADYATLAGALEGHTLDAFGLSTEGTAIIPSAAAIYDADGNNVTANYDITYVNGSLSAWATYARSVTFKVVNGSWNDGTMADKTVLLSGYTGDTLTLKAGDIPAVGMMPGLMFKAGAWDVTPGVGTAITTDLVFTYTYAYNPDWRPVTDNNPGFPLMLPWYLNPDFRVETTAPAKPEEPAAPEPAEPAPVRSALPFTDVDPLSELYEIVSFVYERGLMKGTTNTEFDPFGTMTRGMLVSLLYRIEGSPEAEYSGAFKDVSSSSPYASAVEWAYRNGLVLGYGEKYGPDDPITREQLAVIVQRYVNWKGIKTAKATLNVKDAEKVSEAMRDAVAWAVVNHILALDNGNVRPTDTLLRWEVAYAIRTLIMSAAK